MNDSSSEWMQVYQQTIDTCFRFSDATTLTTTSSCAACSSSLLAADRLNPKGCISKPIRRRSRVSKRTHTTLLNADAKNFRSLVQQFTGCRCHRSTSISFGNPRDAVNINFPFGKEHDYHTITDRTSISQPFVGNNNNCCRGQSQLQQQEDHQQQQYRRMSDEEQECEFSFGSINADEFLLTSSCFSTSGSETPQGLVVDDLYFFP